MSVEKTEPIGVTKRDEIISDLTVTMDFLMCALRAVVNGQPVDSIEVREPMVWATGKMQELLKAA